MSRSSCCTARARRRSRIQTIVQHPDLLASLVAAGNDPVAAKANLDEFRAIATPFGFKRRMRIRAEELRRLTVPTLVVWGDRDPVGSVEVARAVNELIPDSRLEVLPAGHVAWLGNVDRVAALLSAFIADSSARA